MIAKFNHRIAMAAARESLRLPSDTEVRDRSLELFFFVSALVMLSVGMLNWSSFAFDARSLVSLLGPIPLIVAGLVIRRSRLLKRQRRSAVLQTLSEFEKKND